MGRLRERLTFANVVSVIALLLAVGLGSAWAATELSRNEVKSKHIGKGQVKNSDLAANAVTSPKVANGSLLNKDFAGGRLAASMMAARVNAIPAVGSGLVDFRFGAITGFSAATSDLASQMMLSPPIPTVARDLTVRLTTPNPAGVSRNVSVFNGRIYVLQCSVPDSASSCSNTTRAGAIPANSELLILVLTDNTSAGPSPVTDALVTWRATAP
jgi:hypothetical protein